MEEELVNEILARFEAEWQAGNHPDLETVWTAHRGQGLSLLKELVHIDIEYRFHQEQVPSLEQYLERFPELLSDRQACADLVLAELEQRQLKHGLAFEDCLQRFPNLRLELLARQRTFLATSGSSVASRPPSVKREETDHEPIQQIDQYDLLHVLGQGQFGKVYQALDTQLNRMVAIKVPNLSRSPNTAVPSHNDLNLAEARQVAKLNHPHIVPLYQIRDWEGSILLVYQYVSGNDLAKRMRSESFSPKRIANVISVVADAMAYGHSQGILHRDVKPSNILIDEGGHVWLTDFGLAFDMSQSIDRAVQSGTLAYMAPEAALRNGPSDCRTDVYSLGVVLYEWLTGALPFRGSADALVRQLESKEVISPRLLEPSIPRDLELVCLKAIRKSPADRYQSAKEFSEDLARFLRHEPVLAGPVTTVKRLTRWCERRPALAILSGLLLTVSALGSGLLWKQWLTTQREIARADTRIKTTFNTLSEINQRASEQTLRSADLQEAMRQVSSPSELYYQSILKESQEHPDRSSEVARALIELGNLSNTRGGYWEAEKYFQQAMAVWQAVPATVRERDADLGLYARIGLATSFRKRRDWPETVRQYEIVCRELSDTGLRGAKHDPFERDRLTAEANWYLGEAYQQMQQPKASLEVATRARILWNALANEGKGQDFGIELAKSAYLIGADLDALGDSAEAIEEYERAAKLLEICAQRYPHAANFQRDLGAAHHNLARLHAALGNREDCLREYAKAIQVRESLVERFPDVDRYVRDLAGSKANLTEQSHSQRERQ